MGCAGSKEAAAPSAPPPKPSKAVPPEKPVPLPRVPEPAGAAASQAGRAAPQAVQDKKQTPVGTAAAGPAGAPAAEEAVQASGEGGAGGGAVPARSRGDAALAAVAGGEAVSGAGEGRGGEGGPPVTLREFSIDEIRRATGDLRMKLGQGGFGPVFYGRLPLSMGIPCNPGAPPPRPPDFDDGPEVAVKVLKQGGHQGKKEWEAEVRFLGQLSHPHLVRLYGYGSDGSDLLLVYEFVPNRSLDYHLFARKTAGLRLLSFSDRLKAALGAAQGLAFLHEGCGRRIIYRDFKTSNILVDKQFNAKLSDFGLARDGPDGTKTHVSTGVVGTMGYLAPEYLCKGHVSDKADVYSFGVVLLEIISGHKASSHPDGNLDLIPWAEDRLSAGGRNGWKQVVDARLAGQYQGHAVKAVLKAAMACLREDPHGRPSMQTVVDTLKVAYSQAQQAPQAAQGSQGSQGA